MTQTSQKTQEPPMPMNLVTLTEQPTLGLPPHAHTAMHVDAGCAHQSSLKEGLLCSVRFTSTLLPQGLHNKAHGTGGCTAPTDTTNPDPFHLHLPPAASQHTPLEHPPLPTCTHTPTPKASSTSATVSCKLFSFCRYSLRRWAFLAPYMILSSMSVTFIT